MLALVTGASGFIGAQLVKTLLARGDRVRILVRETSNLRLLEGAAVETALGDVTELQTLAKAVEGAEVVYHLAGIRRTPSSADFARVNVEGTRNVLEAASRQSRPPRVVLAGSLSATGPSSEKPLTEDAPFRPVEPYGQSKVEAERLCVAYSQKVPYAIGRAPRVLGPGDRENLAFVKLVNRGFILELTGAPRRLSFIDVDDVAQGFAVLGTHPAAEREVFFVTSPQTLTLTQLQDIIAQTLGKKFRLRVPVAPAALRSAAWAADHLSRLTGKHLPLNHKLSEQLLAAGWWCSDEKARARLGFSASINLEESMARSVRWYVEHAWL
jgi:dihydroflavonol-4-reductase